MKKWIIGIILVVVAAYLYDSWNVNKTTPSTFKEDTLSSEKRFEMDTKCRGIADAYIAKVSRADSEYSTRRSESSFSTVLNACVIDSEYSNYEKEDTYESRELVNLTSGKLVIAHVKLYDSETKEWDDFVGSEEKYSAALDRYFAD